MSLKARIKPFVPPVVLGLLRRPVVSFSGDYASWEDAAADASGYDTQEILQRVAAATRKVVSGEAAFERDSVVFGHIEYSWPLLASLLRVALSRQSLRVIDFGGSLGSTWRQNRRYLDGLSCPVAWHVVEQAHFVALGRKEFTDGALQFDATITEAARQGVDVLLFSSSLCYVSDPAPIFAEAAATSARYLIIDRLPVIAGQENRIALQHVMEPIYRASYPIRLFSEEGLLEKVLVSWRVIESWDCDLQPDPASKCRGYFLEKR